MYDVHVASYATFSMNLFFLTSVYFHSVTPGAYSVYDWMSLVILYSESQSFAVNTSQARSFIVFFCVGLS